jgi:hypothetical protein
MLFISIILSLLTVLSGIKEDEASSVARRLANEKVCIRYLQIQTNIYGHDVDPVNRMAYLNLSVI